MVYSKNRASRISFRFARLCLFKGLVSVVSRRSYRFLFRRRARAKEPFPFPFACRNAEFCCPSKEGAVTKVSSFLKLSPISFEISCLLQIFTFIFYVSVLCNPEVYMDSDYKFTAGFSLNLFTCLRLNFHLIYGFV